jgi:hypothetical protein
LTKWQARFRSWYEFERAKNTSISPQELQKQFPDYRELMDDMLRVNEQLIVYASELKKIIDQN